MSNECEECNKLGWATLQLVYAIEGRTLCWTHAQLFLKSQSEKSVMSLAHQPAFPTIVDSCMPGLSKREFFAGCALSALIDWSDLNSGEIAAGTIATRAVCLADALITELEKP